MRKPRRKIRQRFVEWFHRDVPAISKIDTEACVRMLYNKKREGRQKVH